MAENVEKRTMEMKNWQYATELPALQSTILIVFKDGTRHTEVVYALQANIFRAREARGTNIFQLFPPFCSKRSKHAMYA